LNREDGKAIDVQNLSVYFGKQPALKDVTFSVHKGIMLGIIGPNGGGKSTLLKTILGLVTPDKGKITIFGKGNKIQRERGVLGYVPQVASFDRLFPIKVIDVILSGRLNKTMKPFKFFSGEDKKAGEEVLDSMGIEALKNRQIGQLSGGQLQKVLIARALVHKPDILLLDEPTASIDSQTKNQIYNILNSLVPKITVVVVTHDMAAVSSYFDYIACLNTALHYHGDKELTQETVDETFGCPVDLIAHGVPHRVYREDGDVYHD